MDSTKKHHKEKNVEKEARSHHQIISKKKATSDDLPSHSRTDKDEHNPPHEHKRSSKNEHSGKALINVRKNRDSTQAGNSKSSGSDIENEHHGKHRHHRKKRQHDEDESFEELSRRKRLIESELNALDQEEAEQERARKRRSTRNRSEGHSSRPRAEQPVHVKQEPVSDDDDDNNGNRSRRQRRISKMRHRRGSSGSNSEHHEWGKSGDSKSSKTEKEKVKPNFETSGKLTEDTNTYNGVVIKYNEPAEARKPRRKWRMYPFKGETSLPFIPVHRQSAYLLGRSRLIADIPIDHPSCSKQHAVLQFRLLPYERPDGTTGKSVRPYIIDLDSSNGTYVNNKRIEPRRYVELLEKDVLKFGFSTRVYVLLHEESQNEDVES